MSGRPPEHRTHTERAWVADDVHVVHELSVRHAWGYTRVSTARRAHAEIAHTSASPWRPPYYLGCGSGARKLCVAFGREGWLGERAARECCRSGGRGE